MAKDEYIENLFNNIKDDIQFDRDINALQTLIDSMFLINEEKSYNMYTYIIKNTDIEEKILDIDFTYFLVDFPIKIIKEKGLKKFFQITKKLTDSKKEFLYSKIFNIFHKDSLIHNLIKESVLLNDEIQEKEIISLILQQEKYLKKVFDITEFIKDILKIHLNNNKVNITLLKEFVGIPKVVKDQTLLKVFLLNYNIYI